MFANRWVIIFLLMLSCTVSSYTQENTGLSDNFCSSGRNRSGIALGGIGAGSVELRKNGQFYNWSIMNNWPVFTGDPLVIKSYPGNSDDDSFLFFLIRYQVEGESPRIKLLQINDGLSEGGLESVIYYYPWLSAVENISYQGSFPFITMEFTDSEMPFMVKVQAFSPFIPHDVKNSSLPGIYFNFSIRSLSDKPVKVLLVASLRNLSGYDITEKYFVTNPFRNNKLKGFTMSCSGMDTLSSSYGEMGLYSSSPLCTYYLGWEHKHPYYEKLLVSGTFDDINDTDNRNNTRNGYKLANISVNKDQRCFSSLGFGSNLSPGESMNADIIMSWNFPNLYGAENVTATERPGIEYSTGYRHTQIQGHYYNNFFSSASAVAEYMEENRKVLFHGTLDFHDNFYHSDIDRFVLDQVNSQFNTLITSSTLTRSGRFAIREGLTPAQPWGPNGTIDVSLYGSATTIALFPELQKSTMRIHTQLQSPEGEINHGLSSDLEQTLNNTWGVYHRIDLVPNYIQLVLRDFFWTSDMDYLREVWPSVIKGIHYILEERDKDHDLAPDMDGIMCSYDNFPMYGLSSYIHSQWLAAMKMAREASIILGDQENEKLTGRILEQGTRLMEEKLWNGNYYLLSNDYNGTRGKDEGILTDQIIGQWIVHQTGLGYLFPREHVNSSLSAILGTSYKEGFGLRNCTWPAFPELFPIHESDLWVDQANTCWSGVELAFAGMLLYENRVEEALKVISTVDKRYRKEGLYWDHQEFGGHYYRPMSAWSIMNGYLGLGIRNGNFTFNPKIQKDFYRLFFSCGTGTASYISHPDSINIVIHSGTMNVRSLSFASLPVNTPVPRLYRNGEEIRVKTRLEDGKWIITPVEILTAVAEDTLSIK